MRVYDDYGNWYPKEFIGCKDPAIDDYGCAVRITDRMGYNYGANHTRFYKGNKLVCVCINGDVWTPSNISDAPPANRRG